MLVMSHASKYRLCDLQLERDVMSTVSVRATAPPKPHNGVTKGMGKRSIDTLLYRNLGWYLISPVLRMDTSRHGGSESSRGDPLLHGLPFVARYWYNRIP